MHDKREGVLCAFKIYVDDTHYFHFFIWENSDLMTNALCAAYPDDDMSPNEEGSIKGLTKTFPQRLKIRGSSKEKDVKYSGNKFGEVHMLLDWIYTIGYGYVAHELQHAINFWVMFMEWDCDKRQDHNEDIACLADHITKEFYEVYHRIFDKKFFDCRYKNEQSHA